MTGSPATNDSASKGRKATAQASGLAFFHLPAQIRFWVVAALVLWVDLSSKSWVFATLRADEVRPVLSPLFEFRRSLNAGAVFGFFTGQVSLFIVASVFAFGFVFYLFAFSGRSQRALHVALGLILAGALGNLYDRARIVADVVYGRTESQNHARAIGTVVDGSSEEYVYIGDWPEGSRPRRFLRADVEVRQQGVVRDFLKFVPKFPKWVPWLGGFDVWPWVFNVADSALVIGVGALMCTSWLRRRGTDEQ